LPVPAKVPEARTGTVIEHRNFRRLTSRMRLPSMS
jgi:hypothetical protein